MRFSIVIRSLFSFPINFLVLTIGTLGLQGEIQQGYSEMEKTTRITPRMQTPESDEPLTNQMGDYFRSTLLVLHLSASSIH